MIFNTNNLIVNIFMIRSYSRFCFYEAAYGAWHKAQGKNDNDLKR